MAKNLVLSVIGGLVLFVWGFVSHAVLPWYGAAYHSFTDEAAISAAIEHAAPVEGLYYLPFAEADRASGQLEAFVNVVPAGTGTSIGAQMAGGLISGVMSTFLALIVVRATRPATYWSAVGMFALIGLTIGFVSHAYYWNWFQFPTTYIVVTIADVMVGWTLVGAAFGAFIREKNLVPWQPVGLRRS
jgi:hypothetical protein